MGTLSIALWVAGEDNDLAALAHPLEEAHQCVAPGGIGVPQRVVEQHRDALVLGNHPCQREALQDGELLFTASVTG